MSDTSKSQESELGVTFSDTPERARDEHDEPKTHTPSIEEMSRDSEVSKRSGVFDVTKAFESEHELGTIVTDKRKQKTPLSTKLESAFNEWWSGFQKKAKPIITNITTPKQKEGGEIKLKKAETRVDVIETAATHAAIAPKDDHHVVVEKVKTFKRDVERVTGVPFTIKESPLKPEGGAPRWTHTVDEPKKQEPAPTPKPASLPDLRSSMVAPVVEKHIERDITDFYKKPEKKVVATPPKKRSVPDQIAYMNIPGKISKRTELPDTGKMAPAPIVSPPTRTTPEPSKVSEEPRVRETIGYVAKANTESPAKPLRQGPAFDAPMPESVNIPEPKPEISVQSKPKPEIPAQPIPEPIAFTPKRIENPEPVKIPEPFHPEPEPEEVVPQEVVSVPEESEPTLSASVPREPEFPSPEPEFHREIPERDTVPGTVERAPRTVSSSVSEQKRVAFLSATIIGVILVGVVAVFTLTSRNEDDVLVNSKEEVVRETIAVAPKIDIINVEEQRPILFGERTTFLNSLTQMVSEAPAGIVQFYPTTMEGVGTRTLGAREFFESFGIGLPQYALRALGTSFVLGSVSTTQNEFFIILTSSNFDALFAGMLEWESELRLDFSPLFDGVSTENENFIDGVKDNKAVRILRNSLGEEALVYAFVDKNTVVITTSIEALARLIERM